ncbi:unnamed protein product [Leptidea sinapis]|uniref:Uncharacterized protein n=1 Tax=Leptidea sinapis TaxID=189913 RepID=A0A5E4QRB9_9NEOP|nr:unnamed protein product [Leptidea sinapis]
MLRKYPPNFAETARCAEETIRDCTGRSAFKILSSIKKLSERVEVKKDSVELAAPGITQRVPRLQPLKDQEVQEVTRVEKQKAERISRLMASKYLERMAHDKYFLTALCKDERLSSANKKGSEKMQELANKALTDIQKRQAVLRERRPLYAARAIEADARKRLSKARKERIRNAQLQHIADAKRLIQSAEVAFEQRDTAKCLELAEFAMEQIMRKPADLMPGKEKFILEIQNIVGNAFLDQKRVKHEMCEADREKRAFILLGISISREPSRDSILRTRPFAPPRDSKRRFRTLERALSQSMRAVERCYVLHELSRLYADAKQTYKAKYYALKCQSESRSANQRVWLLNALFLLARCHLLQNNRPEARATLLEAAGLARAFGHSDVAEFFDTCVNVSLEGDVASTEALIEKREKAMVSLMQDNEMRLAAEHLFRRMSTIFDNARCSC